MSNGIYIVKRIIKYLIYNLDNVTVPLRDGAKSAPPQGLNASWLGAVRPEEARSLRRLEEGERLLNNLSREDSKLSPPVL